MSTNSKPGLVLHLAGANQPLHIALDSAEAEVLVESLVDLLSAGQTRSLTTADGNRFTVNFAHVATAHIEQSRSDANAYGAPTRGTGFHS